MDGIGIVLAAGQGRRFWPYNEVRNKCAFPICNEPLAARAVRQLRELGFARIVVVVGYSAGSIRAALPLEDAKALLFVRADGPETPGTATAVEAALRACNEVDYAEGALVVYGDTVAATSDLRATWNAIAQGQAEAAALCAPLGRERPQDWIGADVEFPSDMSALGALRNIEGHGRDATHRLAGVYALSPSALPFLQATPDIMTHVPVGGMPPAERDLAETIARMQEQGHPVSAVIAAQSCVDVDKPWHILEATRVALEQRVMELSVGSGKGLEIGRSMIDPTAEISDGADIEGPIMVGVGAKIGKRVSITGPCWIEAGARILNGAIVRNRTVIGANSRVSDYCLVGDGSVVGQNCIVGHGAEFTGVMLAGSYIYHYAEIYGVVGASVDIGAATVCGTLRFDDANTVHSIAGRRETPAEGADCTYFGDYSRTGVNVITQPGVKIGPYSCVGPGIVVYKDVPSRKLILLKQETVETDWGPERYGW